jgi:hypothetical protein
MPGNLINPENGPKVTDWSATVKVVAGALKSRFR